MVLRMNVPGAAISTLAGPKLELLSSLPLNKMCIRDRYLVHKYLEIKKGKKPTTPITALFGAKAAPAYVIAKDIIHMILCLEQIIDNDPDVKPWLQVILSLIHILHP